MDGAAHRVVAGKEGKAAPQRAAEVVFEVVETVFESW